MEISRTGFAAPDADNVVIPWPVIARPTPAALAPDDETVSVTCYGKTVTYPDVDALQAAILADKAPAIRRNHAVAIRLAVARAIEVERTEVRRRTLDYQARRLRQFGLLFGWAALAGGFGGLCVGVAEISHRMGWVA